MMGRVEKCRYVGSGYAASGDWEEVGIFFFLLKSGWVIMMIGKWVRSFC